MNRTRLGRMFELLRLLQAGRLGGALALVEYLDFVHQPLAFQLEVNRTHLSPLCLGACDSTAASASAMITPAESTRRSAGPCGRSLMI